MPLNTTQVHRNLHTRVTIMYLEFEDMFLLLGLAVLTNLLARFIQRELAEIPLDILFQYIVPIAAIPLLIAFKYGKPRRYLIDFIDWHTKPRIYCGIEPDSQQSAEYLREDQPPCR
jgi:hypothetical protein